MVEKNTLLMSRVVRRKICEPTAHFFDRGMPVRRMPVFINRRETPGSEGTARDTRANSFEHALAIGNGSLENILNQSVGRNVPSFGNIDRAVVNLLVDLVSRPLPKHHGPPADRLG